MTYTARIPGHIIFRGNRTYKKTSTTACWDRLPSTHSEQSDARRFKEKVYKCNYWAASTQKEVDVCKDDKNMHVHANKPMKLTLVGWNFDSLQAALPSGYLIELPLDILYNALRSDGLEKDNKTLKGEFIFAMANRKLVPIKIGSGIHKGILHHIELKNKPKIKVKELVVGNAYSTPAGNAAIFLGYVNTETMVVDFKKDGNQRMYSRVIFDTKQPVSKFQVRFLKKKLATLWYETRLTAWHGKKYTTEEIEKVLRGDLSSGRGIYRFRCKKSHRYVTKVPKFYIDLPTDIVQQVRNNFTTKARDAVEESRLRRGSGANAFAPRSKLNGKMDVIRHYDAIIAQHYAAECNMTLYGMDIIRSDVFKQFEPWEVKKKKKTKTKKKK